MKKIRGGSIAIDTLVLFIIAIAVLIFVIFFFFVQGGKLATGSNKITDSTVNKSNETSDIIDKIGKK